MEIPIDQLYINLLDDELFFQWLMHPTEELDNYWNIVMQEDAEKKEAIKKLKIIIRGLKVKEKGLSSDAQKELWRRIENATRSSSKRKQLNISTFLRYAAILLLILIPSVYYLSIIIRTNINDSIDYISLLSQTPVQDGENITIILGNTKKVEVTEKSVELIHDEKGQTKINAEIIEQEESKDASENTFNQLYVPYGKTTSLIMSDGTKVWVNSGTKIIYPVDFKENKREIYVEGEIYLEVAKNKKRPFVVKTDLLEINVLGTSFNISAYKNDKTQSVVLATGSVSINGKGNKSDITIKPNQQYTLEKQTNKSMIRTVNVFDHICWKYGFLIFKQESLSTVLRKIERYYNVNIVYDTSEADRMSLSGKLDLKEKIEETFRTIAITAPIVYTIQDSEIKIDVQH